MIRRFALFLTVILAVVMGGTAPASAGDEIVVDEEYVIMRTVAGDLILALYPTVAPKTVEQIKKLVRAGVYDTTAFVRIEPSFVTQLSAHWDRSRALTDEQKGLIHKLPAEIVPDVKHTRGVLSMAREDADINSAETSFSILLNDAPHLDGKYTVFGRLESGWPVVNEMLDVPRGQHSRPVVRLEVTKAEIVARNAVAGAKIAPARKVAVSQTAAATANPMVDPAQKGSGGTGAAEGRSEIAGGLLLICLIGLVSFYLQGKVPPAVHGSLNLVTVLVSAFVLLMVMVPQGRKSPVLATFLFFGLIALFRVLGKFEQPAGAPKPAAKPATDK